MKRSILLQIYLWFIITGITLGFTITSLPIEIAMLATFLNLLFCGLALYGNVLIIFPKYYKSKNNIKFILINILFTVILSFVFVRIEYSFTQDYAKFPDYIKQPINVLFLRNFFWMVFLNTISSFYMTQIRLKKQEELSKKTSEEKLSTELKLLKAQINPHFLFNALNNIYSLSYMKSEKAPESILKLSGMLRYVIEDCTNETVKLKSEIEYIEHYIAFQKMKSPDDLKINFRYENVNMHLKVSPMLMIPFIENSIKYSKIEEFSGAYINIEIKTINNDDVTLSVVNSIPVGAKAKSGSGMGIKNVQQRLNILYSEKHHLEIKETTDRYEVHLKLSLS